MSEYQVSDRIRIVEDRADQANVREGDLGTIVEVLTDDFGGYEYRVRMDQPRGDTNKDGAEFHWYFIDESLDHA